MKVRWSEGDLEKTGVWGLSSGSHEPLSSRLPAPADFAGDLAVRDVSTPLT